MKCLSVKQPWSNLILSNQKSIEVRTWKTSYRGDLLIHSGKNVDKAAMEHFGFNQDDLSLGYILGKVNLVNVVIFDSINWKLLQNQHKNIQEYQEGLYGLVLKNPVWLKRPVPYKGSLGFFNVELGNIDI